MIDCHFCWVKFCQIIQTWKIQLLIARRFDLYKVILRHIFTILHMYFIHIVDLWFPTRTLSDFSEISFKFFLLSLIISYYCRFCSVKSEKNEEIIRTKYLMLCVSTFMKSSSELYAFEISMSSSSKLFPEHFSFKYSLLNYLISF